MASAAAVAAFDTLAPGASTILTGFTETQLILAGFTDIRADGAGGALAATRPAFAPAGAPLRLRKRADAEAKTAALEGVTFEPALADKAAAWAALAARGDAAAAAAVDEDARLAGEVFAAPAVDTGGCAPKRKACANCSCG